MGKFRTGLQMDRRTTPKPETPEIVSRPLSEQLLGTPCSCLTESHEAAVYLSKRQVPPERQQDVYFTNSFQNLVLSVNPDKKSGVHNHPSIVFPLRSPTGSLLGVQGRVLDSVDTKLRYCTVTKPNVPGKVVYNLDKTNFDKRVYVTEGIFDALMVPNCLAMLHSKLDSDLTHPENTTLIYDMDYRNREIARRIRASIRKGYSVFLYDHPVSSKNRVKDLNEMVQLGELNISEVREFIDRHTFSGMKAELEFARIS